MLLTVLMKCSIAGYQWCNCDCNFDWFYQPPKFTSQKSLEAELLNRQKKKV